MIKTAIIGAGSIAEKHVQAINRLPGLKVIGVIDINYNNANKIARLCNARVIGRIEDVLDEIDMIHLLTPPSQRLQYAETAMNAGKHILCEKPIAVSLRDAQRLLELSNMNNVFFMTAFNMRFRKGYLMLQEDVLSGKLGDIVSIWIQRIGPGPGFRSPLRDSWRTDPELACGMSIESLSHDIDMIRGLGVEISHVYSWVKGTRPDLPSFDNNVQVIMGLNNGGSATVNASWDSHLSINCRGVIGTKGTAVISGEGFFDFMEYKIFTDSMKQEEVVNLNDPFDAESYYEENKYFLRCIETNTKPYITAENGLEALKVSLAILNSNQRHIIVEL